MSMVKQVAKLRLGYHLNMIDFCNVLGQLHIIRDENLEQKMKHHLKKCLDCYNRLGYNLPKEFKDFMNE